MEKFGKYTLLRRVAVGGMAEIFLACLEGDSGFRKKVVVKRILPQFGADPEFVQMFTDEAVLAARFDHPNVVQTLDFGNVDGTLYITMEYVFGGDLRLLLREKIKAGMSPSMGDCCDIGEQMCRGLEHVHTLCTDHGSPLHVVHRDISPHNIMLSRAGQLKIMDFGIAKAAQRATHTSTGVVKGKLAYMAPEQARGDLIDHRTDQFAAGLVLWEAITGSRPYQGSSEAELYARVLNGQVDDPRGLRPECPEELAEVVMGMLAPSPSERFPTIGEVAERLAKLRFALGAEGASDLVGWVETHAPSRVDSGSLEVASGGTRPLQVEGENSTASRSNATQALPLATGDYSLEGSSGSGVGEDHLRDDWLAPENQTAPTVSEHGDGGPGEPPEAPSESSSAAKNEGVGGVSWAATNARRRPWSVLGLVSVLAVAVLAWSATMESAKTRLRVASIPDGAKIALAGLDTGLRTPAELPARASGELLELTLSLEGYAAVSRSVVLKGETQSIEVALPAAETPIRTGRPNADEVVEASGEPVEAKTDRSDRKLSPSANRPVRPSTPKKRRRPGRVKAADGKLVTRGVGEKGFLSLRSAGPWVEVYFGQRRLGATPLSRVEIPAGTHKLQLLNRDASVETTLTVTIVAGEESRKTWRPK